jgi:hypothetical protein
MHYRGHSVSPVEFLQQFLGDHERECRECGYVAPIRTEWKIEKRDDEGLHYHHICPRCGSEEDIELTPHHG